MIYRQQRDNRFPSCGTLVVFAMGFDRQDGVAWNDWDSLKKSSRLFVLSEDARKEDMTGYWYWTVYTWYGLVKCSIFSILFGDEGLHFPEQTSSQEESSLRNKQLIGGRLYSYWNCICSGTIWLFLPKTIMRRWFFQRWGILVPWRIWRVPLKQLDLTFWCGELQMPKRLSMFGGQFHLEFVDPN